MCAVSASIERVVRWRWFAGLSGVMLHKDWAAVAEV